MDNKEFLRQMIADYRKRVERYSAMIAEWEQELAINGAVISITSEREDEGGKMLSTQPAKGAGSATMQVRDWQFFNKTQPEAARLLLDMTGHPMKTEDIITCLEKGGVKFNAKDENKKKATFYTILNRHEDFAKVAPNTWGLTSWPNVTKQKGKDLNGFDGSSQGEHKSEGE